MGGGAHFGGGARLGAFGKAPVSHLNGGFTR
jgi:hypothetical protein